MAGCSETSTHFELIADNKLVSIDYSQEVVDTGPPEGIHVANGNRWKWN